MLNKLINLQYLNSEYKRDIFLRQSSSYFWYSDKSKTRRDSFSLVLQHVTVQHSIYRSCDILLHLYYMHI